MLIELGNHCDLPGALDDAPKITTIHIPEFDDGSNHPDGLRTGGYTHEPGLSVKEFVDHVQESIFNRDRVFHLPEHEILLAVTQEAWRHHAAPHRNMVFIGGKKPRAGDADLRPAWVSVRSHEETHGAAIGHSSDVARDIEQFLSDYWGCPGAEKFFGTDDRDEQLIKKEVGYWTRTPPGVHPRGSELPPAIALFTDDGRSISNINDGGGQVGATGTGTAATATTLTTASTFTTNQWTGYRVICANNAGAMVWANVISNTNAAGASVLTVDRWYSFATPGGSAGTTPANGFFFALLDGGMTSTWFVGLATGANAPAHGDHTLSTNGNAEITTGGGGLIRKIAPYAQTSGVASRQITLTPVFTANGSDSLPATVTTIGVFASMVSSFGGAGGPMKFETALNASATLSASGDQLSITETISGS